MTSTHSPIARFLGEDAAHGGPFALLGISPHAVSDELVLQALHRRLARVAAHPESETPGADEVRLALHAAAAQLLDPSLRARMLERHAGGASGNSQVPRAHSRPGGPDLHAPVRAQGASVTHAPSPLKAAIEHDAILVLGTYGGWNPRSLHRLLSLAHVRGASSDLVADTLREMAGRRRPSAPSTPAAPQTRSRATPPASVRAERANGFPERTAPRPASPGKTTASERAPSPEPDPPSTAGALLIVVLGILFLLGVFIFSAGALYWAATSAPEAAGEARRDAAPAHAQGDPVEERLPPPDRTTEGARSLPPSNGAEEPRDWRESLADAIEGIEIDPEGALRTFRSAIGRIGETWVELPADRRMVANDLILRFVYRAGRMMEGVESGAGEIASLAEPLRRNGPIAPEEVWPAVWSVGVLTRLSRESDLPASVERRIRLTLSSAVGEAPPGGTFEAGVQTALTALAGPLIGATRDGGRAGSAPPPLEAWKRWLRAVEGGVTDAQVRRRILLASFERLLVEGEEPSEDRETFRVIEEFTGALDWGQDAPERKWLLRWFVDRRISPGDLHALTSALVSRTRAGGVSPVMVLSEGASPRSRSEMRQTYARAWGLSEVSSGDQVESDWGAIAFEHLATAPTDSADPPEGGTTRAAMLADAVLFARLNEAASQIWSGQAESASALLEDIEPPVRRELALLGASPASAMGDPETDGAWAIRFHEAREDPREQLELLNRLKRADRLGQVDAEVLIEVALRSPKEDLRSAARERALDLRTSPAIVNALLEHLPDLPRVRQNQAFIEDMAVRSLPAIRSEEWEIEARRALVERLLELLAAAGDLGVIDGLSRLLAATYHRRDLGPDSLPDEREPQPADRSAAHLWASWMLAVERTPPGGMRSPTPGEAERRRQGRLNLARGPVQRFAAEQVSLCELMGVVVARERPGAVPEVRRVLAELADARRRAGHIFDQLSAAERAMSRLWLIRFGMGSAP